MLPAPRGEIFDRDGVLLAGNKIEQVVTVAPGAEAAHPAIVGELSALLGEPTSEVKAAINNVQYSPYQSVPVKTGVSNAVVLGIDENQSLLPGVTVQAEPVRYYPQGETTANIVGYVSGITGPEYAETKKEQCGPGIPCYQTTSLIGQAGVESSFEDYLRGTPGVEKVQVDSQGQVLGLLSYRPPVPGDNIILSISLNDQRAAVQALNDWVLKARGMRDTVSGEDFRAPGASMVVEDPRNGQVLALATYPDYNPSDFLGGISETKWKYYNNPPELFSPYRPGRLHRVRPRFDLEDDHGHGHDALRLAVALRLLRRHRHLFDWRPDLPRRRQRAAGVGGPGAGAHPVERHLLLQSGRSVLAVIRFGAPSQRRLTRSRPSPPNTASATTAASTSRPKTPVSSRTPRSWPKSISSTPRTTPTGYGNRASRSRRPSVKARTRSRRCSWPTPTPPSPTGAPCTCPTSPWRSRPLAGPTGPTASSSRSSALR